MMRKEIRIAGFGGQGIILVGVILGEAAVRDGKHAVQTQSYGPEARGGAARSEVVISETVIDYPKVIVPDVLIALSQPGYDKYGCDIGPETKIIVDRDLVKSDKEDITAVPFLKTAESVGRKIVANIVMLGYLISMFGLVKKTVIEETILERIPQGSEKLNMKAFQEGCKLGGRTS